MSVCRSDGSLTGSDNEESTELFGARPKKVLKL